MNIIFFSNGSFSIPSLKLLNSSTHKICLAVSNEDKKTGRGQQYNSNIFAKNVEDINIPIYKTNNLKNHELFNILKSYKPDLFIVIEYKILPEKIFTIPKYGSINLHGSLLPKYRGAAPIQRSIMNGDILFGITTFLINNKVDRGIIIKQKEILFNSNEDYTSIKKVLSKEGATLVLNSINNITKEETFVKQNNINASYAPKILKSEYRINLMKSSKNAHNKIRALSPKAYIIIGNKIAKLSDTNFIDRELNGSIGCHQLIKNKIHIKFNKGTLIINNIKLEGKKFITAKDFYNNQKYKKLKFE